MNFKQNRMILLFALSLICTWTYANWSQERAQLSPKNTMKLEQENQEISSDIPEPILDEQPSRTKSHTETEIDLSLSNHTNKPHHASSISITTDVFDLEIDPKGGDIIRLSLSAFKSHKKLQDTGFRLFDHNESTRFYTAQSGLASNQGPDAPASGRATFKLVSASSLEPGADTLTVKLVTEPKAGLRIYKLYTFTRNRYDIKVEYVIENKTSEKYVGQFYGRLKQKPPQEAKGAFLGVQTFRGMALYTPEKPYTKVTFKEIKSKPITKSVKGGWVAMIEQYFLSAWVAPQSENKYQARFLDDKIASIEMLLPPTQVAAHSTGHVEATLYAGPQVTEVLEKLAPSLQLTVDYGLLWPVCQPIFWLLKKIQSLVHNWGLAIILVTVTIKALFYKLSASSYRSMGNMRKLQPVIAKMKAQFGDDQAKFGQAMLELYRKEKVNPIGGCLPLLIQIPVFIALYYVLLGSVELHNAPFFGWISDLSSKDPYYILPLIMGATMFAQQKLSPAPPDPIQAKVMLFMPVIFTGLFFNFPAGLVLYWVVNNLLSITQQWYITKSIEAETLPRVKH